MPGPRPSEFTTEVRRRHAAGESVGAIATAMGSTYHRVYDSLRRDTVSRNYRARDAARLRYLIGRGVMP